MDYKVVGAKQKENWIRLELNSTDGSHITTFIFKDSSRKSFTEVLDMRDYQIKGDSEADKQLDNVLELLEDDSVFKMDWKFIDNHKSPPK
ncbi:hypothetical protein [Paenibacillus sp. ISL-20]|uniref:hypothetical protein n=1 Tax=Paenibacillus sp. ISL-20 TaxID=2819163 RepID=UPI001BE55F78|nr:hypothetical protein [Paenibacillus sp. ISL-20]MBT2761262.1 hypothetical protein [Paenibacillus sp. ISL-20]